MAKDRIRVGIIGSRFSADFHADSYKRNPKVDIVAVGALDNLEEYSRRWGVPGTYRDYTEMLAKEEVDLVSICAPNHLHARMVRDCAAAGKHIVCEKPLATEVKDAEAAVEACRKAGVKLFYAEDWCFAPALIRLIEIVREGAVGDVLYLKAKEVHNGTHSPFARNKATCGGGCLIHLAIHPIGWALHFLGEEGKNPVVEVIGKTNGGLADNYIHKDNGGEDFAVGIMKFAKGQHVFVEGNYITVGGMEDCVEVYGSQGRVRADLTFGSPLSVYSRPGYAYAIEKTDNTLGWTRPAVDEFFNLGYVKELEYAVDCVLRDEKPMWGVSGEAGLACLKIVEAMYRSNLEGRVIRV
ncbi:MAG: Gfo/Idh/MocA family oxidoreductase [Planctomycetota bacterium]